MFKQLKSENLINTYDTRLGYISGGSMPEPGRHIQQPLMLNLMWKV